MTDREITITYNVPIEEVEEIPRVVEIGIKELLLMASNKKLVFNTVFMRLSVVIEGED